MKEFFNGEGAAATSHSAAGLGCSVPQSLMDGLGDVNPPSYWQKRLENAHQRIESGRCDVDGWTGLQIGLACAEARRGRLPENLALVADLLGEVGA